MDGGWGASLEKWLILGLAWEMYKMGLTQESVQARTGTWQKDTESSLNGFPLAKSEQCEHQK